MHDFINLCRIKIYVTLYFHFVKLQLLIKVKLKLFFNFITKNLTFDKIKIMRTTTNPIYKESMGYIKNAEEILATKADKNGMFYRDTKYTKMACGTAYNGVLLALEEYLKQKNNPIIKKKYQRLNVNDFKQKFSEMKDFEMQNYLKNAYDILHLYGYYDGNNSIGLLHDGIKVAKAIVNKIK